MHLCPSLDEDSLPRSTPIDVISYYHANRSDDEDDADEGLDDTVFLYIDWTDYNSAFADPKSTLLHVACNDYGWCDEIGLLLDATLDMRRRAESSSSLRPTSSPRAAATANAPTNTTTATDATTSSTTANRGLFQLDSNANTPLTYALSSRADLAVIVRYLQEHQPEHLHANLRRHLPKAVAQFNTDMTLWRDLVDEYADSLFFGDDHQQTKKGHNYGSIRPRQQRRQQRQEGQQQQAVEVDRNPPQQKQHHHHHHFPTPLSYACMYENVGMVEEVLRYHSRGLRGGRKRRHLTRQLLRKPPPNHCHCSRDIPPELTMSPLGCLIHVAGGMDPQYAIYCIRTCIQWVPTLPVLRHVVTEQWESLIAYGICRKAVDRIVYHGLDGNAGPRSLKSMIHLFIAKISSTWQQHPEESENMLDYLLLEDVWGPETARRRDGRGRLPLHVACAHGMEWTHGLERLVETHPDALAERDPSVLDLLPFCVAATALLPGTAENEATKSRTCLQTTSSVYELLRYNPGVLARFVAR